jgi:hypothetical protein
MPRYKTKVGKIIELPELSGKEMRALKLRRSVTVSELEQEAKAKKGGKKTGGVIKMRGGGLARGGSASLTGYKIR